MIRIVACIANEHDWRLLVLAAAVCTFLCALTMTISTVRPARKGDRGLVAAALLPGFTAAAAIWATHFIAMLAFNPALDTAFEPVLTAGSFLIALTFAVPSFVLTLSRGRPAEGGLLLGAGVGLMHYTGMAAFHTQGTLVWDAMYVAASLAMGLPLAALALVCLGRQTWRWRVVGTGVLVLAICSLHFTAMAAVTIAPDPLIIVRGSNLSHAVIAASAAAAIVVGVIVTVWLTLAARSRQVSFEHLREAISAMSDGIAVFDADRTLVAWNDRFGDLTGLTPSLVIGARQSSLCVALMDHLVHQTALSDNDEDGDDWIALAALLSEGAPAEAALEHETREGGWLRLRNQKAAHGGAVWIVTNITLEHAARRNAHLRELALERDKESAEAASQAKSGFLAMVSHELRTPMNGVLGMAHALSLTELDPRQKDYVGTLIRSGDGLMAILDDVLDLAKIEAGKFGIEAAPFDLHELLIGVHDLWSAKAKAKGLAFALELDPGLPQWVDGDAGRVRQVVLNLISNALKFTDHGGVAVSSAPAGAEDAIAISVTDTGLGIDQATQAQLFQDFAQGAPAIAKRFGGTGLGLSISRKLARLMGGDLSLVSEPGHGSTFRLEVRLPVVAAPQVSAADHSAEVLQTRRVLAVDDNPTNLLVARALLESLGCEVVTAESGAKALKLTATADFDIVFMDIQMPVMDGYETLARLRQLGGWAAQVPVVALTANAMTGERERYLAAGFDDYLSKPIRPDALVRVIGKAAAAPSEAPVRAAAG